MSLRAPISFTGYRGHSLVTGPAAEPVTASALRSFLVETTDSLPDVEAKLLIAEARNLIEEMTGLALVSQEWKLALDAWPMAGGPWWDGVRDGSISEITGRPGFVYLPRYPLFDVVSVTTYNDAGTPTVVSVATTFDIDVHQKPGRLALKSGATWPVALRATNAIEIVYEAGFSSVPPALARAVKQIAAYLYTHKGDDCDMGNALAAAGSLLNAYKVARL